MRTLRFLCQASSLFLASLVASRAQLTITHTFVVNQAIPDGGEMVNVQNLSLNDGTIQHLQVGLQISSSPADSGGPAYAGDLFVSLSHDSGYAVLLNRPGTTSSDAFGYDDSGFNVVFDDSSATNAHTYRNTPGTVNGSGVVTGTLAPDGRNVDPATVTDTSPVTANLTTFNSLQTQGSWQLFLSDLSAGNQGILDSWSLRYTVTTDGSTPLQYSGTEFSAQTSGQTVANPLQLTNASKVSGALDLHLQGTLTGSGTLAKEGTGTLTLDHPNSYTGAVNVSAGTVKLPNGFTGSGGVITVGNGARLEAAGQIARNLTLDGTVAGPAVGSGQYLTFTGTVNGGGSYEGRIQMDGVYSPGHSPAAVTFNGDLSFGPSNILQMEIGGTTAGSLYDQINVTNTLDFGGRLQVTLIDGYTPALHDSYQLFTALNYTSAFLSYSLPDLSAGLVWDTSEIDFGLLSIAAAPETATWTALAGLTVLGIALRRRRTRASAASRPTLRDA